MIVHHHQETFELKAKFDAVDLSNLVEQAVHASKVRDGTITLFNPGSTGGITTIEYESGCLADLEKALEMLAPVDAHYSHNARWGDGNGFSHLRAALIGPSLSVPIINGRAAFSTWQQPIFINFDNRARRRTVHVTVMGHE